MKYRITGRVQGVGFRFYTRQVAQELGLRGWVRNCQDGAVEAIAAGTDGQLEALEEALRRGPTASRVRSVEATVSEEESTDETFEIVY